MSHLIIACSFSPKSRSAVLGETLAEILETGGEAAEIVDLRRQSVPFCDADASDEDLAVRVLADRVSAATTVTLAVPIYNFDVGPGARNLVAVLGSAWRNKVVAFICAAGGRSSYMSVMALGNSLMLDFRCLVLPRFVYAARGDDKPLDPKLRRRLEALAADLTSVSRALVVDGEVRWAT